MRSVEYRLTVIAIIVIAGAASVGAQDLPVGWRLPTPNEVSDKERNDSPTRYAKATADFNGDGIADDAILLKSSRYSGEALWVRLSTDGRFMWIKLNDTNWGEYPSVDLSMGVDVAPPGTYRYGCFDDDTECNYGDKRRTLKLHDPSILYFRFESAGSMYFWSYKYRRFRRVWIGD